MPIKLKDYVLNKLDQREIFSKYLGIDIAQINYCINNSNEKISNPLRTDRDPSLSFKWYGNKLIARDFAERNYRGDVFQIVGIVLCKNSNNANDFFYICTDIIDNCTKDKLNIPRTIREEEKILKKEHLKIEFVERRFNNFDYKHFNKFGLSEEYVDGYIRCADSYSLNDWRTPYRYKTSDPCYVYDVNPNCLKLSFSYRDKRDTRFITNNRCPVECLDELEIKEYSIFIKGYKDKVLLHRLLDEYHLDNFNVLPFSSETAKLTKPLYDLVLSKTTSGRIFSIMDLDKVGIEAMTELENEFSIEPIYFTHGFNAKDPTDMVALKTYRYVYNHFEIILNSLSI